MNRETLQKEYDALLEQLSSRELLSRPQELATTSRRLKEVQEELEQIKKKERRDAERHEAEEMLQSDDPETQLLAQEELARLSQEEAGEEKKKTAERQKTEAVILEIRPGTGGEEAALFAADLGRMYRRFAERKGWKVTVLDQSFSDLGGLKEIILSISGPGAYQALRHEGGIHRVQRVPDTEKSGRIHTSAASVVSLPKVEAKEFHIPASDLRIDTMRAGGPGGQLVNRRESAVRIVHLPTGIMVTSQAARTQNANREQAMEILLAKLAEKKRLEEAAAAGSARRSQIGSGDRSEKIRTYNFPQDRVTDHRVGKSWHNLPTVLDGDLDDLTASLQEAV